MIGRALLVFEAAQQRYALPVSQVREVLPRAALTPLPEGPAALAGILRLRGALLPVVDLRRRLGLPPTEPRLDHCIVVALLGPASIGILVDAVDGLISVDGPDALTAPARAGRMVEWVVETSGGVVTVLNTEAVVGIDVAAVVAALAGSLGAPDGAALAPGPAGSES